MNRRSVPQAKIDDRAFPVRVLVRVPDGGLGNRLNEMHRWLEEEVGRGSYAAHGGGPSPVEAMTWHFRRVEEAQAFVAAFPGLELADGTELPTYASPHLPFGRGADWIDPVCNLYSMPKSQEAMRRLFDGLIDRAGNMPPLPGIYPDYLDEVAGPDMVWPQATNETSCSHGDIPFLLPSRHPPPPRRQIRSTRLAFTTQPALSPQEGCDPPVALGHGATGWAASSDFSERARGSFSTAVISTGQGL